MNNIKQTAKYRKQTAKYRNPPTTHKHISDLYRQPTQTGIIHGLMIDQEINDRLLCRVNFCPQFLYKYVWACICFVMLLKKA